MFSFGKTSHEESWFGPRQLVQTGPEPTQANDARRLGRLQGGVSDDLVRLSIGIEEEHEIIRDLEQALDALN